MLACGRPIFFKTVAFDMLFLATLFSRKTNRQGTHSKSPARLVLPVSTPNRVGAKLQQISLATSDNNK
jgi:hypothetical protein